MNIATDRAAFAEFYLQHFDDVLGFVTRRVSEPQLAADLTADVFVAALESASSYRGDGPPGAWLIGIARRVVAAEYRRGAGRRAAGQRLHGSRLLAEDDIAALVERIDAQRDAHALYEHIQQLPSGERDVLELVAVDGLGLAEAAAVLGIRPTAARVRMFRARRFLREKSARPTPEQLVRTSSAVTVEAQS
jgi:RNA polymerase sigma-70 factor (ECF subfamily)